MNQKKRFRQSRKAALAVRLRRGRSQATRTQVPMVLPDGPNQRGNLDAEAKTLSWVRRIRILT